MLCSAARRASDQVQAAPSSLDHGKSARAVWLAAGSRTLAIWLCFAARTALACPDCTVGRAARAQLWADAFALKLGAVVLPFLVVFVASLWADRLGRPRERR